MQSIWFGILLRMRLCFLAGIQYQLMDGRACAQSPVYYHHDAVAVLLQYFILIAASLDLSVGNATLVAPLAQYGCRRASSRLCRVDLSRVFA